MTANLSLDGRVNRHYLPAQRRAVVFLSTDIQHQPEAPPPVSMRRLNICLAIDCSESMSEAKLDTAKQAALRIVNALRPQDLISVVKFESTADVVVPRQPATNRHAIQQHIQAIALGNATALYDGLQLAYQQLDVRSAGDAISRILLLTDGAPTKGPSEHSAFVNLSQLIRQRRASITALGIGDQYREDLLAAIATAARGQWYHVNDIRWLPDIFSNELTDMHATIVVSPTLTAQLMPGATVLSIYQMGTMVTKVEEYARSNGTYHISLEDIRSGQLHCIIFAIRVPLQPTGVWELARLTLTGPGIELTTTIHVETTENSTLWEIESDIYPRAIFNFADTIILARGGIDDPTLAQHTQDLFQTLMRDPSMTEAMTHDQWLQRLHDTIIRVTDQTVTRRATLTDLEKKRLKSETTIIRKV
jgi:Ca-activated chloride channel family protein